MATKTVALKCTNCQNDIVFDMPIYEIVNTSTTSMMIFSHPIPDICNHCGQGFVFAIDKSQPQNMFYGWVPVQLEQVPRPSNIIEPPAGQNWKDLLKGKKQ